MRPAKRLARCMPVALALGLCGVAVAQTDDGLSMRAAYSVRHDDNLFRLPDGVNPQTVLGRPSAAETTDISSVGLHYEKSYSLQRIELDVSLVDYRYQTHKRLDLRATNYDLAWHWAFTPRLRGTLRAGQDESVNSFDDASVLTSGNQRTRRQEAFDAQYEIDGVWRVVAGAQSTLYQNEQPIVGQESFKLRSVDMGLRYDARSGSSVTLRLRRGDGNTIGAPLAPVLLRDPRFTQDEQVLDVNWLASAKTSVNLNLTHLQRHHERLAIRDYSGTNAALSLRWAASAKTLFSLGWSTDISSYQTNNASYARTDRITASHVWQIAARTRLQTSLSESRRHYLGPPPGRSPDTERESTQDASIALRWAATRNFTLDATLQHTRRSGNRPGLHFSASQATLGVTAGF